MAEHGRQEREPVGSVAEETARLVEALGGWAEGLRAQHADARPDADARADAEPADAEPAGARPDDRQPDEGRPADGQRHDRRPGHEDASGGDTARCEHCGVSSRVGEAQACRLCPVCQGIALLRTVRPETVERLADVAAALSGALRDLAADRFGQPPPTPQPSPPRGQRVQDIVVDDEDDDDQGAPPRRTDPSRTRQESTTP